MLTTVVFMFEVTIAVSQFPTHTDYQKIGEITFNNENYRVYKPTIHTVTDYFKSYMLGEVRRTPKERLFIDKDGFRHEWLGWHENRNFRKTNVDLKNETTTVSNVETTKKPGPKRKNKRKAAQKNKSLGLRAAAKAEGKMVAKTTMFCPFFGIITMHSFLE